MKTIKKIKQPILITGAAGFLGSNFVRFFVLQNTKVHILIKKNSDTWRIKDIVHKTNCHYVDLKDKNKLEKTIKKIKPKTIFHFAANGAYSYQDNPNSIKENILDGTINLLNECSKYKFTTFINTGSSSEYGFKNVKMKETDFLVPNSHYSMFKSAATLYCQNESLIKDLPIVTVRPFHVFGPYEEPSRLIPTILNNFIKNKKTKLVSPNISRDLIYIDDVINFYILISQKKNLRGKIFNLGFGKKISIKLIYDYLKKITNSQLINKWNSMNNRKWDQPVWYADMSYVKTKLKWSPKINYKKGLYKTYVWHKKFYIK